MSVCQYFILLSLNMSEETLTIVNVLTYVVVLFHVSHLYALAFQEKSISRILTWDMPLICGTTAFTHLWVIRLIIEQLKIAIEFLAPESAA